MTRYRFDQETKTHTLDALSHCAASPNAGITFLSSIHEDGCRSMVVAVTTWPILDGCEASSQGGDTPCRTAGSGNQTSDRVVHEASDATSASASSRIAHTHQMAAALDSALETLFHLLAVAHDTP